ncbi:hypothetical protein C8J56DRAFT_228401 [Mycena floridula]|nr:hypothetical protein C8J56DRAFT_228401 [Mycena floridula]
MDHEDPIAQFFPGQESVDLYAVLSLKSDAKTEEIKKSYRRLALLYHPDKHTTASDSAKTDASTKFQQISFAYSVLSDDKRKQRYDRTGKTDEGFELAAGDEGWEAYFEQLFDRVTGNKLEEHKKIYQGSAEEIEDLKVAYIETKGFIGEIMTHIPHSTHDDESRFVDIISKLITDGVLSSLAGWKSSIKDEKAKLARKRKGEKEAKEAEQRAKELGVWDEFYGSGKVGARQGKGKGNEPGGGDEDYSALQALILKKKQKDPDSFFDSLAAKYAEPASSAKSRGKKRAKAAAEDDEEESPKKKSRRGAPPPPEIDDAEFEKLQQKLFGDKTKSSSSSEKKQKGRKTKS